MLPGCHGMSNSALLQAPHPPTMKSHLTTDRETGAQRQCTNISEIMVLNPSSLPGSSQDWSQQWELTGHTGDPSLSLCIPSFSTSGTSQSEYILFLQDPGLTLHSEVKTPFSRQHSQLGSEPERHKEQGSCPAEWQLRRRTFNLAVHRNSDSQFSNSRAFYWVRHYQDCFSDIPTPSS